MAHENSELIKPIVYIYILSFDTVRFGFPIWQFPKSKGPLGALRMRII